MKVVFSEDTIFASGLSYDQARQVAFAAGPEVCEHWDLHIKSAPDQTGWMVVGQNRRATEAFLKNPKAFVVEIEE